jgi:hypothetical protein
MSKTQKTPSKGGHSHAKGGDAPATPTVPEKPNAALPGEDDTPSTDEQALDEALAETFPASDPISPSAPDRKPDKR